MPNNFHLALVTGATSGIGKSLSKLLASKRIPLILTGRNQRVLEELKEELSKLVPITTLQGDLSQVRDRATLSYLIESAVPDLVINNAGFGLYGDALSHPITEQLNIMEVNGMAPLELTLVAAKALIKSGREGVIMNISSAAGFQVFPGMAVYAASKAFVTSFSQSLDKEFEKKGVRVLASCPGFITTGFSHRASKGSQKVKPKFEPMNVEFAAQEILWQITKRKPLHIFDWRFRLATFFSYFVPKSISSKIVYKDILRRIKEK